MNAPLLSMDIVETANNRFDRTIRRSSVHSDAVPIRRYSMVSSHSTNSTASDLPGPGRTLDKFLGILGRKLEDSVARIAHKVGLGPLATQVRLAMYSTHLDGAVIPFTHEKLLVKHCKKLLKYMDRYSFVRAI